MAINYIFRFWTGTNASGLLPDWLPNAYRRRGHHEPPFTQMVKPVF